MIPIKWELTLTFKNKDNYEKTIIYLARTNFDFNASPIVMLERDEVSVINIECSWISNLKQLSEWITNNISEE